MIQIKVHFTHYVFTVVYHKKGIAKKKVNANSIFYFTVFLSLGRIELFQTLMLLKITFTERIVLNYFFLGGGVFENIFTPFILFKLNTLNTTMKKIVNIIRGKTKKNSVCGSYARKEVGWQNHVFASCMFLYLFILQMIVWVQKQSNKCTNASFLM